MKLLGDLGIYPQITQIKKPETRNQKLETKKSLPVERSSKARSQAKSIVQST
jgi:hypothetical protein